MTLPIIACGPNTIGTPPPLSPPIPLLSNTATAHLRRRANGAAAPTGANDNRGKLKELLTKYGKAGLLVWVVVSILVLFACYTAIELGIDMVCVERAHGAREDNKP